MILLGLTGPIACGKTTVLRLLQARGAKVIDADVVVHELMAPGQPVWRGIVSEFGHHVLRPDQTIDRQRLGAIVFKDQAAMRKLERIVHPATREEIESRLQAFQREKVVVLEAIKFIEGGYHKRCHAVWIVTCDPAIQVERLRKLRDLSIEEAQARLRTQAGWENKFAFADIIIHNNGTKEELEAQVDAAWQQLLSQEMNT